MSTLTDLLARPPAEIEESEPSKWFDAIADELLLRHELRVAGEAHTLVEIEFYLDTERHRDPFIHGDPIQRSSARWYFHRAGQSYRGGTYKGLDITFAPPSDHGGILIRSLRTPTGEVINGSALCIEHLLRQTGHASVATLDAALGPRPVDTADNPIALISRAEVCAATVWRTARVGLTLKRVHQHPSMVNFVVRPYRYLTAPRELSKGRVNLVLALHEQGFGLDEIVAISGSPKHTVKVYLAAYSEGLALESSKSLWGKDLNATALCRLHGALAPASR